MKSISSSLSNIGRYKTVVHYISREMLHLACSTLYIYYEYNNFCVTNSATRAGRWWSGYRRRRVRRPTKRAPHTQASWHARWRRAAPACPAWPRHFAETWRPGDHTPPTSPPADLDLPIPYIHYTGTFQFIPRIIYDKSFNGYNVGWTGLVF